MGRHHVTCREHNGRIVHCDCVPVVLPLPLVCPELAQFCRLWALCVVRVCVLQDALKGA